MDPDETLRLLRFHIAQYRLHRTGPLGIAYADEIVAFIETLDEWLTKGGFSPWTTTDTKEEAK